MTTRRRFLEGSAIAGSALLAGCGVLGGGDGETNAVGTEIPDPAAIPEYGFVRAGRYDVQALRANAELVHRECRGSEMDCTPLQPGIVRQSEFVLGAEEIETVVTAGTETVNVYPRSPASLLGRYLFKVYDYTVDASTLASRLSDRYATGDTAGQFQYYVESPESSSSVVAADDGTRLIVGLAGPVRTVVERIAGDHQSFEAARPDRATARDHLGDTVAEYVTLPSGGGDDAPDWYDRRTAIGQGVAFVDDGVTYRGAIVFEDEAAIDAAGDASVRAWAETHFGPAATSVGGSPPPVTVERTGKSVTLTATADEFVGLL
jgi:hypothetical protein